MQKKPEELSQTDLLQEYLLKQTDTKADRSSALGSVHGEF